MATTAFAFTPAQSRAGERFFALANGAAARLAAVWRAAQNRRAVAKLLQWDDHMLRDIGLTQGDVYSVMATPAGEDPSRRLSALSAERRAAIRAEALERLARGTEYDPNRRRRRRFELLNFET